MAFAVKFELRGVREALQKLSGLRESMQRRILRKGVRAACQIGARIGKSHVPRETGLLRKSLGYKIAKAKSGAPRALGIIGPRNGWKRDGRNPVKYAHLIELGTKPHSIAPKNKKRLSFTASNGRRVLAKTVQHPGVRPTRFLLKIQMRSQGAMSSALRSKITSELLKQAAKARPSEVDDGQ